MDLQLSCHEGTFNRLLKNWSLAALASSLRPSFTGRKLQSSLLAALPATLFQQPGKWKRLRFARSPFRSCSIISERPSSMRLSLFSASDG